MKPNLDQGNPDAKRQNSPGPLPKTKSTNISQTKPMAKAKNSPTGMSKNREGQTYRKNPSSVPPRDLPDDGRIHRELTSAGRNNRHSRSGR